MEPLHRDTLLYSAAREGHLHQVERLLHEGANPNSLVPGGGVSAFHLACGHKHPLLSLQMVCSMLTWGADPNLCSQEEQVTPVQVAAMFGRSQVLRELLDQGGNPLDALDYAREEGHVEVLVQLNKWHLKRDDAKEETEDDEDEDSDQTIIIESSEDAEDTSVYHTCQGEDEPSLSEQSWNISDTLEKLSLGEKESPQKADEAVTESSAGPESNSLQSESSPESITSMMSDVLVRELRCYGEEPGPVTPTTKRVYLRRLARMRKRGSPPHQAPALHMKPGFSVEMERVLCHPESFEWAKWIRMEEGMTASLQRGGEEDPRKFYNYLLLDPRLLPPTSSTDIDPVFCRLFASAIFYVGKGQESRRHDHFREAILSKSSKKTERIQAIWSCGLGVVPVELSQNATNREALTREAALIEALGLENLANCQRGQFHGAALRWTLSQRRMLGCKLCLQALRTYLMQGQVQLRPQNLAPTLRSPSPGGKGRRR